MHHVFYLDSAFEHEKQLKVLRHQKTEADIVNKRKKQTFQVTNERMYENNYIAIKSMRVIHKESALHQIKVNKLWNNKFVSWPKWKKGVEKI